MNTRDLHSLNIHTDDLPPIMVELIDLLDVELAMRLIVGMAGQKRYVPPPWKLKDASELCILLGKEGAEKLCNRYQGEFIEYPGVRSVISVFRRQLVTDMAAAKDNYGNPKYTRQEIIATTSYSNRNIKRILEGKAIVNNVSRSGNGSGDIYTLDIFDTACDS